VAELRVHGHREEALALAGKRGLASGSCPAGGHGGGGALRLARALYEAERWQEARALFAQLALVHSDSLAYKRYLGIVAARPGDRAEAARVSQAFERMTGRYLRGDHTYYRVAIAALLASATRPSRCRGARSRRARLYRGGASRHGPGAAAGYAPLDKLMKPKG